MCSGEAFLVVKKPQTNTKIPTTTNTTKTKGCLRKPDSLDHNNEDQIPSSSVCFGLFPPEGLQMQLNVEWNMKLY